MSSRIKGLVVTLDHDMRDDDAEEIINVIKMIRGILEVTTLPPNSIIKEKNGTIISVEAISKPFVGTVSTDYLIEERTKNKLFQIIYSIFHPKN